MADITLVRQEIRMIDTALRQVKERALSPLAARLPADVTPLFLTGIGGLFGLVSAGSAALGWTGLGVMAWALNRLFDGLDGTLARIRGTQSDVGGYLDIMVDFAVYALIPFGLVMGTPADGAWVALAAMLAAFYVNAGSFLYLSALLERRQNGAKQRGELTSITMPTGLIEGTETVVFYSLFFLFPAHLTLLMSVFGGLVVFSAVGRMVWALRHL